MEKRRVQHFNHRDGLDPELLKIYRDGNGRVSDVSRLQIYRRNWAKRAAGWTLIFGLTAVAAAWLFNTFRQGVGAGANPGNVEVTIDAPEELASGEEVTYAVYYRNVDRVALSGIELTLRYPEGFSYVAAEPKPSDQYVNSWRIGALAAGGAGVIRLTGKVVGPVGSLKTLAGTVNYQPENFSATFKDDFSTTVQITSSILNLSVTAPERVVIEQELAYLIRYENTADKPFSGVMIQVDYPPAFVFRSANPAPKAPPAAVTDFSGLTGKDPNSRWYFTTLEENTKGEIRLLGGFTPGNQPIAGDQVLIAHLGLIDETGGFSLQQEQRVSTVVVRPALQMDLIINGQRSDQPVNLGDTLNYRVVYKNLGQETLTDVAIVAAVTSGLVDWTTLEDKNLGSVSGTTIRWGQEVMPELAAVGPLGEGTIDFSVQLRPSVQANSDAEDLATVSVARAHVGGVDGLPASLEVTTNPITNSVNTALELQAEGRYFDEDNLAVGSGPLPPVVGEKTTFRIYWSLKNSLHPVKLAVVTATLATDAVWENKFLSSTGQLSYDAKDRVVRWTIPQIAAQAAADDVNGWFDVAVTPKSEQAGKLLLLTSETNLTATDAVTNASVIGLKRSITSNLEDDPFGGGRGLVVELGQ